jgi:hypothetical protein
MATKEEELHDEIQIMRPSDETFNMHLLEVLERLNARLGAVEGRIEGAEMFLREWTGISRNLPKK